MKLAELYQEAARFAKMIEGTNLTIGDVVKVNGNPTKCKDTPLFNLEAYNYEFALAIVEGKPVFKGDIVYHKEYGAIKVIGAGLDRYGFEGIGLVRNPFKTYDARSCTLSQPKPKTVMVELLRENAKYLINDCHFISAEGKRVIEACKKALEE